MSCKTALTRALVLRLRMNCPAVGDRGRCNLSFVFCSAGKVQYIYGGARKNLSELLISTKKQKEIQKNVLSRFCQVQHRWYREIIHESR